MPLSMSSRQSIATRDLARKVGSLRSLKTSFDDFNKVMVGMTDTVGSTSVLLLYFFASVTFFYMASALQLPAFVRNSTLLY